MKNITDLSNIASLTAASTYFQYYIDNIGSTTNKATIYTMQGDLITHFESVTFNFECYEKKLQSYQQAKLRCADGDDTLANIYTKVISDYNTNDDDCTYNVSGLS